MPAITCYRLTGTAIGDLDLSDMVDAGENPFAASHVHEGDGFAAQAFVQPAMPRQPKWASFLRSGFEDLTIPDAASASALLIVRMTVPTQAATVYAFAFGTAGRHMLRTEFITRGFGLRTALNAIYPSAGGEGARLRAVESKRRGQTVLRTQSQASSQAEFEVFEVNQLQDVLGKAVGTPDDIASWGQRMSGGDALSLSVELSFDDLGRFCRDLEECYQKQDYKDRFGWIDHIKPVSEPELVEQLEAEVLRCLREGDIERLDLAPPEIVDWERVAAFRYPFDRKPAKGSPVAHPELRLRDYLAGLTRGRRTLDDLTVEGLRRSTIRAIDADGSDTHRWSAWRCLVGEIELDGSTYLLDEGDLFVVGADYVSELDDFIANLPQDTALLPDTYPQLVEGDYNETAATLCDDFLLLDKQTVRIPGRTTAIEICDLLSASKQLIHVKRHLGSSDLSHLFAQGVVSAELLQTSVEFRTAAAARIAEVAGTRTDFDFVSQDSIRTADFEVVYAIAAPWKDRALSAALPFFSKVNLREAVRNLTSRGFRVAAQRIWVH